MSITFFTWVPFSPAIWRTLTWEAASNVSDGFGPVSDQRDTDFTTEFEGTILILIPNAMLVFAVLFYLFTTDEKLTLSGLFAFNNSSSADSSTIVSIEKSTRQEKQSEDIKILPEPDPINDEIPTENHLFRYRILLIAKLTTALLGAASMIAAAASASTSNAGGSSIFGCVVSALGLLLISVLSYRHHQKTLAPSNSLQMYALVLTLAVAIRVRTEWLRSIPYRSNDAFGATLTIALGPIVCYCLLEGIPRITSRRKAQLQLSPDIFSSIFGVFFFHWMQPLMGRAYRLLRKGELLEMEHLWNLRRDMRSEICDASWEKAWQKERLKAHGKSRKPRFWFVIFKVFGMEIMVPVLTTILYGLSQFGPPLILNALLSWLSSQVTDNPAPLSHGYELAAGMGAIQVVLTICSASSQYTCNLTALRLRGAIMSSVFRKSLLISPEERNTRSIGDITNHVIVDSQQFVDAAWFLQVGVALPIQLGLATYFLYQQLGWAVFPGLGFIVFICFGLGSATASIVTQNFGKRMAAMDKRTQLVNESISGIKFCKFQAWELSFIRRILELRKDEIKALKGVNLGFVSMITCTNLTRRYAPLIMFALHNFLIARLTAQSVFVSLTIIDILTRPVEQFSQLLEYGSTLVAACKRISAFLDADELHQVHAAGEPQSDLAFEVSKGDFSWTKDGKAEFQLKDINFAANRGSLVSLVGRVGSGKSSLLSALLGQIYQLNGEVKVASDLRKCIGYCPQSPFVINATVKDNILYGLPFNADLFDQVLDACALRADISTLKGGLEAEIGEKGINLSGGQKARVGLARICYAVLSGQTQIVLLDDVLSAVDAHTEKHLFENVIAHGGILGDTTRIVVTHAAHLLHRMDSILYLEDGVIVEQGNHDELMASDGQYRRLITEFTVQRNKTEADEEQKTQEKAAPSDDDDAEDGLLVQKEGVRQGRVTWSTYWDYIKAGTWQRFALVFLFLAITNASSVGASYWISDFVSSVLQPHTDGYYFAVYAVLLTIPLVSSSLGAYSLMRLFTLHASQVLFERMLYRVFRSPMSFFDVTPVGRILNRFATDVNQLDFQIGTTVMSFTACITGAIGSIIAAGITTPYLFLVVALISPAFAFLLVYYQAASRGCRRLDAGRTRAPMFSLITEVVEGAPVIKALGLRERYRDDFYNRVDLNQRTQVLEASLTAWLSIRTDGVGALFVFAVSIFVVVAHRTISPGLAGLAIQSVVNAYSLLGNIISRVSAFEMDAVHVERVLEFTKLESEAPLEHPDDGVDKQWPAAGAIEFQHYSTRYREGLPLVIDDLSLKIAPKSKLAIVGRTGSGKSTMTVALFRLIEAASDAPYDGGKISIDGVDISKIGLARLRSNVAIIPQEATLFGGTLRENLSPFGEHSDARLWDALEKAHLKEHITLRMSGGLDAAISSGGGNLSKGQLQQLSLARALLHKAQILILDEATSSVDLETDSLIQKTIRANFADCTVLTIAHRIRTVMDSDMVLVLENGKLAEYESRRILLQRPSSLFYQLAKESGETDDVGDIEDATVI